MFEKVFLATLNPAKFIPFHYEKDNHFKAYLYGRFISKTHCSATLAEPVYYLAWHRNHVAERLKKLQAFLSLKSQ